MTGTTTHFTRRLAPCGHVEDGDSHVESDPEGLSFNDVRYTCGCRRVRHVFHDGSVRIMTTHHSGRVLSDEHSGDHEA
jgi:hypothetical protein